MIDEHVSGFDHHRTQALLPWWVNGTLDASEQSLVERHLHECAPCQEESEFIRQLNDSESRRSEPRPDVNAALTRVLDRIDQKVPDQRLGRVALGSNVAWLSVAAAALLAFGALTLLRQVPDTASSTGEYSVLASSSPSSGALQLEVRFNSSEASLVGFVHVESKFGEAGSITAWEKLGEMTYRYTLNASVSPVAVSRALEQLSVSDSVSKAALVVE